MGSHDVQSSPRHPSVKPFLIDTHCHLHFPAYDADRDAVLARMRAKDIWAITVATSIRTSADGIAFAEKHDDVWATVGYHPEHLTSSYHDASEGPVDDFDAAAIKRLAMSSSTVVAIGETGLDFLRIDPLPPPQFPLRHWTDTAKKLQEDALRQHIVIAHELGKPIVIHCRDAFQRLAEIIQDEQTAGRRVAGVVHCFTGSWEEAKPLLDLGLHLSFTGIITFPPKKSDDPRRHVHRVIEQMPLERLLVETGAPWLAPVPHRGKQNEPTYVEYVAQCVGARRGVPIQEIARQTTENAIQLFHIYGHNFF